MPLLSDAVLDAACNHLKTNGTMLHICSSEPANFAAIAAVELASAPVSLTGPAAGDVSGRKVTIPAITADTVDVTGSATHYALSNGVDELFAANTLKDPGTGNPTSIALSDAGNYNFNAMDLTIP
ncbi:hypothetical protein DL239_21395, partial [Sedimentitalea sp. CY04]